MPLDLNMRYYHIQLTDNVSNLCTIIIFRGKYRYKCLPTRIVNTPDILQQKINYLYHVFEFIYAYIDNILILTKGGWKLRVQNLEWTVNKMKGKWLKCNIEKYFFGHNKMKYLGFWVTHSSIKPINRKIEAIKNMKPPTYQN